MQVGTNKVNVAPPDEEQSSMTTVKGTLPLTELGCVTLGNA